MHGTAHHHPLLTLDDVRATVSASRPRRDSSSDSSGRMRAR